MKKNPTGKPGRHRSPVVSSGEQRYVSVLLAGQTALQDGPMTWRHMERLARHHGGAAERLADDTVATVFSGNAEADETAHRAARMALALRAACPGAPLVVTTGRGVIEERLPMGEVIDQAVDYLLAGDTAVMDRAQASHSALPILLDELTAALLERRFHITRQGGQAILVAESPRPSPARLLLGRPTRCVGRKREIASLEAIFAECVEDSVARVVLLTGPMGAGKSRLGHEAIESLRGGENPPVVFMAHGDSMRAGSPLAMLGQLLCDALAIAPSDSLAVRRRKITQRIHNSDRRKPGGQPSRGDDDRVISFLGEIAGARFPAEGRRLLREARSEPQLMHDQMLLAWQDWLAAETENGPVVLTLDDLQWGDEATIRFIGNALRALEDHPLMVLAMARPEIDAMFPNLWAARQVDRVALRPLSRRACATIAQHALPDQLPDDMLHRLIDRSGGNPLYLEELLRSAAAGELDQLPATVLAMVGTRLRALPPSERRVLRAASVFGRDFWLAGLAALLGDPIGVIESLLARLVDRELVLKRRSSRFAGQAEYAFTHDVTREAAYATLPAADRESAHHSAGWWLEELGELDPIVLAEHYHRGRVPGRALPWLHRAAEQALAASDMKAAIEYAERAVKCGPDGETLGALRLIQAEAHNWNRDAVRAQRLAREARAALPRTTPRWSHAAHQLAWASAGIGDLDELVAITTELLRVAPEQPDDSHFTAVVANTGLLVNMSRSDLAQPAIRFIVERKTSYAGNHQISATIAELHAILASHEGRITAASGWMAQAVEHWTQMGNERRAFLARFNAALYLRHSGQYRRARHLLESGMEIAQRLDLQHQVPLVFYEIAGNLACDGELQKAREVMAQAPPAQPGTFVELNRRVHEARLLLLDGHPESALRHIETLETLAVRLQFPDDEATALALRTLALLAQNRPDEALVAADKAMAILDQLGGAGPEEGLWRLVYAEALDGCGRRDQAIEAIGAARERLLARVELIADGEAKAAFLQGVAEHRRTMELARRWTQDLP